MRDREPGDKPLPDALTGATFYILPPWLAWLPAWALGPVLERFGKRYMALKGGK